MSVITTAADTAGKHQWRFSRLGGFDQVQLNSAEDLLALPELDQKLWAALSCPARGLEIDAATLAFLDSDGDGRIRVPEILAAVAWTLRLLKRPDDLLTTGADLPLATLNDRDEEALKLLASAREILKNLGRGDADTVTWEDITNISEIFADTRFNGDGVIPAKAADNDADRQLLEDIIVCYGGEPDRCGEPGVNREKLDQFFQDLDNYIEWWGQGAEQTAKLPLGNHDAEAITAIFSQLQNKIDDFFTRRQLAEFDARAGEALNPPAASYELLAGKDLTPEQPELIALPLANIAAGPGLPLSHGLNPAWDQAMAQFNALIVTPLFGECEYLSLEQWRGIVAGFTDYLAWQQQKPSSAVAALGIQRLLAILADHGQQRLAALIDQDEAVAPAAEAMDSVKKLLHYRRDLPRLLNNFVNFRDFYAIETNAIFQAGTLYLDGRSCRLCIRVDDLEQHAAMAAMGGIYLAYCQCRRSGGDQTMTIAAAVTAGGADNLILGRNGIFYDRTGQDWDATIVKIIDHPISLTQAFWSPYQRLERFVSGQMEKFAAAKDQETQTLATAKVAETGQPVDPKAPAPSAFDVGRFAGIFAAIGLAIGAIGTAIASVVSGFLTLAWWQMPLALLGVMLLISGPSVLMALLRMRQRNLAPLLDASGWAINTKALINLPFARSLTSTAKLPANALRQLQDPFAEQRRPWRLYLLLTLLLAALAALAWQQLHQHQPPHQNAKVQAKTATGNKP